MQLKVKPTPLIPRSRALHQLLVITLSFNWFIALFVFFVIGWSDNFGFGFTTLN